jgi:hypothetical protein
MNIDEQLEIDYSKIAVFENVSETMILSQELLDKYAIKIDESKIEKIIAEMPEAHTMTMEEKLQYIKRILDYDVTEPIKNLLDDVLCFVSKL